MRVVQPPLQSLAEQLAETETGADAVGDPGRGAHLVRGEVESELTVAERIQAAAHDRGRCRVVERRSMDETLARRSPLGTPKVEDPAETADLDAARLFSPGIRE